MKARVIDQDQAIAIAKAFLERCRPDVVTTSHITARHIAGKELVARQNELKDFFAQNGQPDAKLLEEQLDIMGLRHGHWSVLFFFVDKPNTASTTPPTIVRVYEDDGHVEIA